MTKGKAFFKLSICFIAVRFKVVVIAVQTKPCRFETSIGHNFLEYVAQTQAFEQILQKKESLK